MKFVEYPDRDLMMIDLANTISGELNSHLIAEGHASLAVPGGTTPGPVFDSLCAANLDWANVSVMLSDERWVPEDSPRSNTRLLRERLLVDRAAAAKYVPLYAAGHDQPEPALEALGAAVSEALPLSVLLLGMGEDMHTASLFPNADGLEAALANDAPPILPVRTPDQPEARITLTARVLKDASNIHIVLTGPGKRAAFERARSESDPIKAPVTTILHSATIHWAE